MLLHGKVRLLAAVALTVTTPATVRAAPPTAADMAQLQQEITELKAQTQSNTDRGEVENLFSRYMYLHNAFHDPEIIPLWVKKGTPGVHAQYSNNGVYTNWDHIMLYHAQRPHPKGKLTFHYVTTPLVEVAADGQTAKGLWVMSGVESGLTDPAAAKQVPDFMFEKEMVDGKRVWMHTVLVKYGIDFLKQDGEWKIWHFHCWEIARSPFGLGWIPFAAKSENNPFSDDLMYIGDDGKPIFMPKPDEPVTMRNNPYRTDTSQDLDAPPPVPYRTFSDTFAY